MVNGTEKVTRPVIESLVVMAGSRRLVDRSMRNDKRWGGCGGGCGERANKVEAVKGTGIRAGFFMHRLGMKSYMYRINPLSVGFLAEMSIAVAMSARVIREALHALKYCAYRYLISHVNS